MALERPFLKLWMVLGTLDGFRHAGWYPLSSAVSSPSTQLSAQSLSLRVYFCHWNRSSWKSEAIFFIWPWHTLFTCPLHWLGTGRPSPGGSTVSKILKSKISLHAAFWSSMAFFFLHRLSVGRKHTMDYWTWKGPEDSSDAFSILQARKWRSREKKWFSQTHTAY